MKDVPVNTWMVVQAADAKLAVVSTHGCQQDAERERDQRNAGLSEKRFNACVQSRRSPIGWVSRVVEERLGSLCRTFPTDVWGHANPNIPS
jgi:hypothetical protein